MKPFALGLAFALLASPAVAWDLTGLDYLVDAKAYGGREVTVRDCTIIGAMASIVMCNVQSRGKSVGNVLLDGDTMDRTSLRRALSRCPDMEPAPRCRVALILGKVRINGAGEARLENATIQWERQD